VAAVVIFPLPKSIRKKLTQPDTPEDAWHRLKINMVIATLIILLVMSDPHFHWCSP
jgi:hypothetical protein